MCCGGGRPIRAQPISRSEPQKTILVRKINSQAVSERGARNGGASMLRRQAIVRDDRCSDCGKPVILVNIAGKERKQCSNCRLVQ